MLDFSKLAAIISTSQTPVLDALGIQFGVPDCLLNFGKGLLNALPSPALNAFSQGLKDGKAQAEALFKEKMREIFLENGIVEYDTHLGRFVFVSNSSNNGVEQDLLGGFADLKGLGEILGFGAGAWLIGENILDQLDEAKNCLDKFKTYEALQAGPGALASEMVGFNLTDPTTGEVIGSYSFPQEDALEAASEAYESNKASLEVAAGFSAKCDAQIKVIGSITKARAQDPLNNPEPAFNGDLTNAEGVKLSELLEDTSFTVITGAIQDQETGAWTLPEGSQGGPEGAFDSTSDIITPLGDQGIPGDPGPPVAKEGQFLFSKKGLYYDSYSGGIPIPDVPLLDADGNPVIGADGEIIYVPGCISNIVDAIYFDEDGKPRAGTGVPEKAMEFILDYNPNLGGHGEPVSWNTYNKWANTVFDINNINETPQIQSWYDSDHFLQVLIGQRNREIYDLSGLVSDYDEAYGSDSAIAFNERSILYAKISTHDSKINRRKKQIEIHYTLNPLSVKGDIPINNLEDIDSGLLAVHLSIQEQIMFSPGEVSGVVLPICPEFLKSSVPQDAFTLEELNVPTVGVGGIINVDKAGVAGTSGTVLSLNDHLTVDGLVTIYNFLDSELVKPDSSDYQVINCITSSTREKPAQLCGSSVESLFPSGIGIPFFRGVCNFFSGVDGDGNAKASRWSNDPSRLFRAYRPYGYAKIQPGWNDTDSLFYKNSGVTIETWMHIPDLGVATGPGWNSSNELSALHRVVLGCENRGGTVSSTNEEWIMGPKKGSDVVKGLLLGFSRDRRLTASSVPSNNPADNSILDGMVFHMSPTQSINTSGVTFLAVSGAVENCNIGDPVDGFFGISIDTSTAVNGKTMNDVSSAFCLMSMTVDYGNKKVSLYLDGQLMKTRTVEETFGTVVDSAPGIPSLADTSSFQYSNDWEDRLPFNAPLFPTSQLGQTDFWYYDGPNFGGIQQGPPTTPWVIGGGYTDGMLALPNQGVGNVGMNFMGGKWGGKKSGLNGFLGSFKLYNKALSPAEVTKNFQAQRGFFKNLKT